MDMYNGIALPTVIMDDDAVATTLITVKHTHTHTHTGTHKETNMTDRHADRQTDRPPPTHTHSTNQRCSVVMFSLFPIYNSTLNNVTRFI